MFHLTLYGLINDHGRPPYACCLLFVVYCLTYTARRPLAASSLFDCVSSPVFGRFFSFFFLLMYSYS